MEVIFLSIAIAIFFIFVFLIFYVLRSLSNIKQGLYQHLRDNLDIIQGTNKSLGERLEGTTQVVSDICRQLGRLEESTKQVLEEGKKISSLHELLQAPKIRGGIGELFLEDILRQVLPSSAFSLQYEFKNRGRVDAVIMCGSRLVSVDAKFPLESFKRFIDEKEPDKKSALKKIFINDVKEHIKTISEKYILPDEGTFDFALMYIPAENVYYETIVRDEDNKEKGVFNFALSKKVIPVSPNTFYAYLCVILFGLRGLTIEKKATQILENISRFKVDFGRFNGEFYKLRKHINNSKITFDSIEDRLAKLTDKLKYIESLPASPPEEKSISESSGREDIFYN